MQRKTNLISIGEMSKISGINIKCLRYYDAEGILIPAWINPDTGYRYYDVSQTAILEVIECCLSLDIPLKVIKEFLNIEDKTDATIKAKNMCNYGMNILEERVKKIYQLQKRMDYLQREMQRGEEVFKSSKPVKREMRRFYHMIKPYEGNIDYINVRKCVAEMLKEARKKRWKITYNFGVLFLKADEEWRQHLYVDLWIDKEDVTKYPEIMMIESGEYICFTIDDFQSEKIIEESMKYVDENKIELIEVSELFKSENKYPNPDYEIRIKLKE